MSVLRKPDGNLRAMWAPTESVGPAVGHIEHTINSLIEGGRGQQPPDAYPPLGLQQTERRNRTAG